MTDKIFQLSAKTLPLSDDWDVIVVGEDLRVVPRHWLPPVKGHEHCLLRVQVV